MISTSIIQNAKSAMTIEDLAAREGIKLRRAGSSQRGACPLCGAGAKSASPPFSIRTERQTWLCFACGRRGDAIDLERDLRGGSIADAARRLAGAPGEVRRPRPAPNLHRLIGTSDVAAEMLAESRPIEGSIVLRYLSERGIDEETLKRASGSLRFHPLAKHHWDQGSRTWVGAPAMLAPVIAPSGPTGGVHVTYLALGGATKAALVPAKKMWGPQNDAAGRLGGAWLIGPGGEGDLVVAEGLENVLSYLSMARSAGRPMRGCAALSLDRLQGGLNRDAQGCVDLFRPSPDPARPPFTCPAPEQSPWSVIVAVDHDMSPIRLKGRTGRGRECWFEVPALARARLCAWLACAAWRATGVEAQAAFPPPGLDFNDVLRGERPA